MSRSGPPAEDAASVVGPPAMPGFPAATLPPEVGEALAWMHVAWEDSPAAVGITHGRQHRLVWQNGTSRRLFGRLPLGLPMAQAVPTTTALDVQTLDRVLATGESVTRDRHPVGLRDPAGQEVFLRYLMSPYGPPGGPPVGVVISAVDLSGEARAELAANRSRLAAQVAQSMNAAPDPVAALQALTDVLVPQLADVAVFYLLPDVRDAADLASHPGRPQAVSVAADLAHLGPPPTWTRPRDEPAPFQEVLAAGRPVLIPFENVDPASVAPDPAARAWLLAARARNLAVVPLSVAGTLIGALVLAATGDRQPYSDTILPFLTDLAAYAGLAVAQLRHHQIQADTSHRLQNALLPVAPPPLTRLQVTARYLPGSPHVDVGGDWWDVVRLDDTHVAVGVGDACGRGVEAAILMGQARAAARALTLAGLSPSEVLALVDRHLAAYLEETRRPAHEGPLFATALHGVLDLTTGRLGIANAGHLPVLLHHPDHGSTVVAIPPGTPLGLGVGAYAETVLDVPPGTSLLLFTDGLVEDRTRDLGTGLASLATELATHAHLDVDSCLDTILTGLGHGTQPTADDIAAVLLRRPSGR